MLLDYKPSVWCFILGLLRYLWNSAEVLSYGKTTSNKIVYLVVHAIEHINYNILSVSNSTPVIHPPFRSSAPGWIESLFSDDLQGIA